MAIYLDSASATIPEKTIVDKYLKLKSSIYASASSYHQLGLKSRAIVENSRQNLSNLFNCLPSQLYFANSISQSNNLVVQGVVKKYLCENKKVHMIFSSLDHISLTGFKKQDFFKGQDVEVEIVSANSNGLLKVQDFIDKIKDSTRLISFPFFSAETGAIQEINKLLDKLEIVNSNRESIGLEKVLVYVDGASLARYFKINLKKLNIDFLSLSPTKSYGVGGSSLLFVRNQNDLKKIYAGGTQEKGIIPGGEQVAEIYALNLSLDFCQNNLEKEVKKLKNLKEYLVSHLPKGIKNIKIDNQLDSYILLTGFKLDQQSLLTKMDMLAIETSLSSVCASGGVEKGWFLKTFYNKQNCLRIVLGKDNSEGDMLNLIDNL